MSDLDVSWDDPVAADLAALGQPVPTGLAAYENPDPVESGAPDLPAEVVEAPELLGDPVPPAADEFVCDGCFLVWHRARLAPGHAGTCRDCA